MNVRRVVFIGVPVVFNDGGTLAGERDRGMNLEHIANFNE
jgi:hypothetical protein